MKYKIFPIIGSVVEMQSSDYEFKFFNTAWQLLPGAKTEMSEDCLIPVDVEVLWQRPTLEIPKKNMSVEGYTFSAKLRPWDMEIIDGIDDADRLDCGASYLISDAKKRFYIYKIRDGLAVLFFKKELSGYINRNELERMNKEAMNDYREFFETPYYEFNDELFEIRMT